MKKAVLAISQQMGRQGICSRGNVAIAVPLCIAIYILISSWDYGIIMYEAFPHTRSVFLQRETSFMRWMNSSEYVRHKEVLEEMVASQSVDLIKARSSLDPDIIARGKFQQSQMEEFCKKYNLPATLPRNPKDLQTLYHHLLYDDSKRLIFCYVPKIGCSNVKRLLLVLNGALLPVVANGRRPAEELLKQVHSFTDLSPHEIAYRLHSYYKFIIIRNPAHRLLSAYRNKLEPPINHSRRSSFPDDVKMKILEMYRSSGVTNYTNIHPSFSEFIRYMTEYSFDEYNEHFVPILNLCYPCAVQYNFYANFKVLNYDVYAVMGLLNITSSLYPTQVGHPRHPTGEYLTEYYGKVAKEIKQRVFDKLTPELEFYYSLYPEEHDMHKSL